MKASYTAAITINSRLVTIEFSEAWNQKTECKITSLGNFKGIKVTPTPENSVICGFRIEHSVVWDGKTIAKECFNILKDDGYEENTILLQNFTH